MFDMTFLFYIFAKMLSEFCCLWRIPCTIKRITPTKIIFYCSCPGFYYSTRLKYYFFFFQISDTLTFVTEIKAFITDNIADTGIKVKIRGFVKGTFNFCYFIFLIANFLSITGKSFLSSSYPYQAIV